MWFLLLTERVFTAYVILFHSTIAAPRNGRFFSADTNKADEPSKAEEAETVDVPPSTTEKLLVLGGNGFVGSHVCKEALNHGLSVASLSRSGKSSIQESWANKVNWHQGLSSSTVSCVGGFGSNSYMYKINGTANINAIRAAAEQVERGMGSMRVVSFDGALWVAGVGFPFSGEECEALESRNWLYEFEGVKRFVYISAADFGVVNYLLQGYYEGKRGAETELVTKFTYGGVILRPGFIYGTRRVGSMKLPLGVIGSPLEMVLQHAKPLNQVPLVGPLFTTPVNVTAVAKVAVRAATDHVFPPGIIDVYGILRYSQQKSV
ncbi:hypothetical protein RJ639_028362 [Escallonia herrerae]|uniref:NAD-dependent epimerase/dehydratase domain-containing protein n=1 Tax=Escallonia herrerae TaxID=1293975 RepID=A0AA88X5Q3_9ASTE|nr:hypothetical protein RJ639_028362 [Escallonia herrerae]